MIVMAIRTVARLRSVMNSPAACKGLKTLARANHTLEQDAMHFFPTTPLVKKLSRSYGKHFVRASPLQLETPPPLVEIMSSCGGFTRRQVVAVGLHGTAGQTRRISTA